MTNMPIVRVYPDSRGHGAAVGLPTPERISDLRVRQALESVISQNRLADEARRRLEAARVDEASAAAMDLDENTRLLTGADNLETALQGRQASEGASAARSRREESEALSLAAQRALTEEFHRLVATVEANREPWRKQLHDDASASLTKLVNVQRALALALAELEVSVGLLEMLELGSARGVYYNLTLHGFRAAAHLSEAHQAMQTGIASLADRLEQL